MSDQTEPTVASGRRPSVQQAEAAMADSQRRGSLDPTPNIADARRESTAGEIAVSSGQQNAPGRTGSVGEKIVGAIGYGGSMVERPKEDQGLGEKIVKFLGA